MKNLYFIALLLGIVIPLSFVLWTKKIPIIVIMPEKALLDEQVEISIVNLTANEAITIEASCKNQDGDVWTSHATFQANDKGVVNVAKQAPISGSYAGVDPMGLFWSMTPTSKDPSKNTVLSKSTLNLCEVLLSVFSKENKLLNKKTIYRLSVSPDIERKDVREQGIVGTLFYPQNIKNCPGLLIIPGSGGGIPEKISQLLASHGYTVLALAYLGVEKLPNSLSLLPLEYFHNAMQWLKKQPQVGGNKIALIGQSRGAECVLLLASLFPGEMDAVIPCSGTNLVYDDYTPEKKSPWTYKDKPLSYMPYLNNEEISEAVREGHIVYHKATLNDPWQNSPVFLYTMKKFKKIINEATIPVENIRCPILIISGEEDNMLPSSVAGKSIMEQLNTHNSKIQKKLIIYPNAGHAIFAIPYSPSIDLPAHIKTSWVPFGGTQEGNARAQKESWQEVLDFLKENLEKQP